MSKHYVYRLFDERGALLYIGCTSNVERRIPQHWTDGTGGHQSIHHYTSTEYPNRASARAAEADAIRAERPPFNRQHNGAIA